MLLFKDEDGKVHNEPFAFRDGRMSAALEQVADYMIAAGHGCALWENVAADRLGTILAQNVRIKALTKAVADQAEELAVFGISMPIREVAK